jgi:hypothetical protein
MHECPNCGFICDCDGEDTWHDDISIGDCDCDCEELGEDYEDDDEQP